MDLPLYGVWSLNASKYKLKTVLSQNCLCAWYDRLASIVLVSTCMASMALQDVLRSFAETTTMHGVPKVIRAKSVFGRCFWSVVCLAAAFMFCVQMAEVLQRYYSYPKKVTVEIVPISVPFPSISICNMRNLDAYVLNQLNRKFLIDPEPYNHINGSGNPFIKTYMKTLAKYSPLWYKYQAQYAELFQEVFSRTTFSANIPEKVISSAAVQLDDFLVNCLFSGHSCNRSRDFTRFFDPYYFNCFTYNAPKDSGSLSEGIDNGWSAVVLSGSGMLDKNKEIRMLPGLHEWRSPVSSSEGIRVVIHPPNTQPYPFTEGYDIPTGFSASLGIYPRNNLRIGPPHGNCSDRNPFDTKNQTYRLMACQKMCIQANIVKTCGCLDVSLPYLAQTNVSLCRNDDEFPDSCMFNATQECFHILQRLYDKIQCARTARARMTKNTTAMEECHCYPPCHEVAYDVSYSLARWPAARYEGDAAYYDIFYIEQFDLKFSAAKRAFLKDYFDVANREETMKDFARLNVYIADSTVVKTEETEEYGLNQLVSDIGGQMGLWVGLSLITCTEVLELILHIFGFFTTRYRSVPTDDHFKNNIINHVDLHASRPREATKFDHIGSTGL